MNQQISQYLDLPISYAILDDIHLKKWAKLLDRIWLILSIMVCLFIVSMMILFVSTTDILYIRICRSGSHIYVIAAAVMTLIISLHIVSSIAESEKTLKTHCVSINNQSESTIPSPIAPSPKTTTEGAARTLAGTVQSLHTVHSLTPSTSTQKSASQQTLTKFTAAKRVVMIKMAFCALLIPIAVGAIYSVITHDFPQIDRHRHDRIFVRFAHPNPFLIYYIMFLLLYLCIVLHFFTSTIATDCIWRRIQQYLCGKDPNSIEMKQVNNTKKVRLKSPNKPLRHPDDAQNESNGHLQNGQHPGRQQLQRVTVTESTAAITDAVHESIESDQIDFDHSELRFHAFSNTLHSAALSTPSPNTFDPHRASQVSQQPVMNRHGTNVKSLLSYTVADAEMSPNLAPIEMSLGRINSRGEEIGKRGKGKLVKHGPKGKKAKNDKKNIMAPLAENIADDNKDNDEMVIVHKMTTIEVPPVQFHVNSVQSTALNDGTDTFGRMISDFEQTTISTPGASSIGSGTSGDSPADDSPVTTVVFELKHVLCTNTTKIATKTAETIKIMSATEKALCFGGTERIAMFKSFLRRLCSANGGTKCFIVAQHEGAISN